jgi:hypothetical protein
MTRHQNPSFSDGLVAERDSNESVLAQDKATEEAPAAGLSRREMLKATAGAVIAVPLVLPRIAAAAGTASGRRSDGAQAKAPSFFSKEEFMLVDELTELIIPTDDHSPGARAAEVAAYIDQRLSESPEPEVKVLWHDGLHLIDARCSEMHGRAFLQATPEQRVAVLVQISRNERDPKNPEERFFNELKSRTARAYYSSKIGIHKEMEYKGNSYLKEFVGYDGA